MERTTYAAYWSSSVQSAEDVEPLLTNSAVDRQTLNCVRQRQSCFEALSAMGVPVTSAPGIQHAQEEWELLPSNPNDINTHYVGTERAKSRFRLQRELTRKVEDMAFSRFVASDQCSRLDAIRLKACAAKGAGLWKTTLPTTQSLHLPDRATIMAIRFNIGLQPYDDMSVSRCACGATIHTAHGAFVPNEWHAHSCPKLKRRAITTRHDRLLIVIRNFARRCGVPFYLEPNDYTGRRPDGDLAMAPGPVMTDVTVGHPLAPSYRSLPLQPLATAKRAAKKKHRKYDPLALAEGRQFTPFAMETFGGLDPEALELLKHIASEHVSPGAPPSELLQASRMLLQVRQELAICLQRYNSEIVAQWARIVHSSSHVRFVVRLNARP
jgi:hypothetical protein